MLCMHFSHIFKMRHVTSFLFGDIFVSFVHQLRTTITLLSRRAHSCNVLQLKTHFSIKLVRNGHIPFFQTLFWGTFYLCNLYVHGTWWIFFTYNVVAVSMLGPSSSTSCWKSFGTCWNVHFSFLHPQSNVLMFQCKARPICSFKCTSIPYSFPLSM
jgi:hypothetical protein